MTETVLHQNVGQKYRLKIERAASTKGVDGFTVEANGDDMAEIEQQAASLYAYAKELTQTATPEREKLVLEPKEAK